jgi:hypothetical protein
MDLIMQLKLCRLGHNSRQTYTDSRIRQLYIRAESKWTDIKRSARAGNRHDITTSVYWTGEKHAHYLISNYLVQVDIERNCGSDNECVPDLVMTVKT